MNGLGLADFFDPGRLASLRSRIDKMRDGLAVVVGAGASLLAEPDVLVYADMARWEIQQRQRRNEPTAIAVDDHADSPALQYKRGFFVDWRAADRLKVEALERLDFLLDTHDTERPKMIDGDDFRRGLADTARRPFRVVPFFDPGPWGGQWMKSVCDLPREAPNYAWCFDCVPEENSLLLGFGTPSSRSRPSTSCSASRRSCSARPCARAIRSRVPDPVRFARHHGGRQSLASGPPAHRVHPATASGCTTPRTRATTSSMPSQDAGVYLGVQRGHRPRRDVARPRDAAQAGGLRFDDDRVRNRWPARAARPLPHPGRHRALFGRRTRWCWRSAPRPTSSRSSCGTGVGSDSTGDHGPINIDRGAA